MGIRVTRARPEQAERLTQIAHAAKSYWGYPAQWIEMWHNQLTITKQFIVENEVYAAADDDETLLGFYALIGSGERLTLEHLWVQPRSLHGGVGRLLFEHAARLAAERGAREVEIEADPNAEAFYAKMGAETVGEVTYELEGLPRSLPLMLYTIGGPHHVPPGGEPTTGEPS
jgi:GNAT superfamily N-acetyltransferase